MSDTPRYSRIEVSKEALNFSIAHFTIFSATEREDLHGHNFQLTCAVTAPLGQDGLMFDYGVLKKLLRQLCDDIDEQMILPEFSPHLRILHEDDYIVAVFNGERIPFLPRDVTILPVANTTVEEFSWFFLNRILEHPGLRDKGIIDMMVKISSSPGQFGVATWSQA